LERTLKDDSNGVKINIHYCQSVLVKLRSKTCKIQKLVS